ncbi:MAG: glycosyltransferase, partial [Chitinophagaceae bacterium]
DLISAMDVSAGEDGEREREEVIEEKIKTTFATTYPKDKFEVWIGSDCSSDRTDEIIKSFLPEFPNLHFIRFDDRTGKPQIINELAKKCTADVLALTDADTFFDPFTLPKLVAPFAKKEVGGVQAHMISVAKPGEKIAAYEVRYYNWEMNIKKGESQHGSIIGAMGSLFALRSSLYVPVPKGFISDDFFIFMQVLRQGFTTVYAEEASCLMVVSGQSDVQFRRKARISQGNFQNFGYFTDFLNPFRNFKSFAYVSHKVLRWVTPFLMIAAFLLNAVLAVWNNFYEILFYLQVLFYALAAVNFLLQKIGIKLKPLRFIHHFVWMNFGLLAGFWRYTMTNSDGTWSNKK